MYGDGTQSSAAIGSSPVAVASHVTGNMSSHVAPQVATVSEEALPPLPGEQASDPMGSDV